MRIQKTIFLLILNLSFFTGQRSLLSEGFAPVCNVSNFNPDRTLVTFYGDSLGDFVDNDFFGYFGWETYLTAHNPSIHWKIQNTAVGGWTTRDVYDLIKDCSSNKANRKAYKTADNVAIEIGGNDYKDNLAVFTL